MIYDEGKILFLTVVGFLLTSASCTLEKRQPASFEVLDSKVTGLNFTNYLTSTDSFNLFEYMYFFNGAGVGAGDFNKDGKIDLFFSSNQGNNTLYINKGNLRFVDVSAEAKIPKERAWNTGVSVVDINNDGLLDIYVCRVGNYKTLKSHNQLLICDGIDKHGVPYYSDQARQYGLDFSGFSTQAAFLDYDMDGDLDMFLLNHSVHQSGSFRARKDFLGTYNELSGDRIYRNDGNHFTNVTPATKINSSIISYGLGVVPADINLDGYPDLYVGNDFHENDYLYINQKDGTFKEDINDEIMHTSKFSMGVDAADATNDGYPEIISVDMMPADPYILKTSLGENEYDVFNSKIKEGYNYQYTRNNLQLSRGNGMFSEVGLYSGVASTDWSWSPLWVDFDNDGTKDLFISNGIPKRMNDIDYINFISDQEIQQKMADNRITANDEVLIDKFPKIKLRNKFFKNDGQLMFQDMEQQIKNDKPTYSNGAIYADLDNDGDLDIVVNNIDDPILIYENKYNNSNHKSAVQVTLIGPPANINAIGAKVVVFANGGIRLYEKYATHGFQSSMEIPLQIGLDKSKIDSISLIWPDNSFQPITISKDTTSITIKYQEGLPLFDYDRIARYHKPTGFPVRDITSDVAFNYRHIENSFIEFDREPLIPHMLSTEGPALAVADINHDDREDIFIGSSKGYKSAVFLQTAGGKFSKCDVPVLETDSTYEDVSACWTDVNNDDNLDLVVASGGNEFYGQSRYNSPRVYLNDGTARFSAAPDAFNQLYLTASSISPYDFNADGFMDLFIGSRCTPSNYGEVPRSYLLMNDKTGKFIDVTSLYAKDLAYPGFVTRSVWFDLDKDGDQDLILSLEWDGIIAFINNNGRFAKKVLTGKKGWWNFALPVDVDKDGDVDLVAGNLGENSKLKASETQPVKMYYNDFDDNGKKEQILTYYVNQKEIPFNNKAELEKQMPFLKKKFLYAKDFAKASLEEILTPEKITNAKTYSAEYFSNAILINDGTLNFLVIELPGKAQLAPYRDAIIANANGDDLPDIFLVGNYYENNIEMGRYDADFGTLIINKGNSRFSAESLNGLAIKGQSRYIQKIKIGNNEAFIIARNNDSTMLVQFTNK